MQPTMCNAKKRRAKLPAIMRMASSEAASVPAADANTDIDTTNGNGRRHRGAIIISEGKKTSTMSSILTSTTTSGSSSSGSRSSSCSSILSKWESMHDDQLRSSARELLRRVDSSYHKEEANNNNMNVDAAFSSQTLEREVPNLINNDGDINGGVVENYIGDIYQNATTTTPTSRSLPSPTLIPNDQSSDDEEDMGIAASPTSLNSQIMINLNNGGEHPNVNKGSATTTVTTRQEVLPSLCSQRKAWMIGESMYNNASIVPTSTFGTLISENGDDDSDGCKGGASITTSPAQSTPNHTAATTATAAALIIPNDHDNDSNNPKDDDSGTYHTKKKAKAIDPTGISIHDIPHNQKGNNTAIISTSASRNRRVFCDTRHEGNINASTIDPPGIILDSFTKDSHVVQYQSDEYGPDPPPCQNDDVGNMTSSGLFKECMALQREQLRFSMELLALLQKQQEQVFQHRLDGGTTEINESATITPASSSNNDVAARADSSNTDEANSVKAVSVNKKSVMVCTQEGIGNQSKGVNHGASNKRVATNSKWKVSWLVLTATILTASLLGGLSLLGGVRNYPFLQILKRQLVSTHQQHQPSHLPCTTNKEEDGGAVTALQYSEQNKRERAFGNAHRHCCAMEAEMRLSSELIIDGKSTLGHIWGYYCRSTEYDLSGDGRTGQEDPESSPSSSSGSSSWQGRSVKAKLAITGPTTTFSFEQATVTTNLAIPTTIFPSSQVPSPYYYDLPSMSASPLDGLGTQNGKSLLFMDPALLPSDDCFVAGKSEDCEDCYPQSCGCAILNQQLDGRGQVVKATSSECQFAPGGMQQQTGSKNSSTMST